MKPFQSYKNKSFEIYVTHFLINARLFIRNNSDAFFFWKYKWVDRQSTSPLRSNSIETKTPQDEWGVHGREASRAERAQTDLDSGASEAVGPVNPRPGSQQLLRPRRVPVGRSRGQQLLQTHRPSVANPPCSRQPQRRWQLVLSNRWSESGESSWGQKWKLVEKLGRLEAGCSPGHWSSPVPSGEWRHLPLTAVCARVCARCWWMEGDVGGAPSAAVDGRAGCLQVVCLMVCLNCLHDASRQCVDRLKGMLPKTWPLQSEQDSAIQTLWYS